MGRMGAPDRGGGRFGDAQVAHLASCHELGHGADGILDRHARVDAVDVIEVDHVGSEALEARLAGRAHIFRPPVGGKPQIAEFGRQHEFAPLPGDGRTHQLLVLALAVGVRGIDEIDAELRRTRDGLHRIRAPRLAVDGRHAHAAKPDGRDLELAQTPPFHVVISFWGPLPHLSACVARAQRQYRQPW